MIVDVEATPARTAQEVAAAKTMLERVASVQHMEPDVLAADKRYGTGSFLAWLKERAVTAHMPVLDHQQPRKDLLTREAFTFDPERNVYICPQGKILAHRGTRSRERIRTYCARVVDCRVCPLRPQCPRGARRFLSVPCDEAVRQEAIALHHTARYQRSRRLRETVEMLFAHMKRQFRFTRLKLRGLAGATEEFLLMATVQNLCRLIRMRPPEIPQPCPAVIA